MQNSRTEWRRVNQDSLKSRQRCEKAAKQTLASSACVIIDRMNFDAEQRAHWVKLASEFSSPCYVLCLKYPAEVCAARGSQRSQHEGGVMGDQASKLAFMMSKSVSGKSVSLCATYLLSAMQSNSAQSLPLLFLNVHTAVWLTQPLISGTT